MKERPVFCLFCNKQMYYSDNKKFEPETEFKFLFEDDEETEQRFVYIHNRCLTEKRVFVELWH
jgi:hypothetical protein